MSDREPSEDDRRTGESRNNGAERRTYKEDHYIFREGETGDMAFIIMDGTVQITTQSNDSTVVLSRLANGSMFGEMALIDDEPRMASAQAVNGPVEALVVSRQMFQQKLNRLDPFTRTLIKILSANVRQAGGK